ncbi:efflux RND transporter permease subunit [Zhihengliuella halotolerans]|uniref:efflux RND transporter permease subunit n=1 Tax=Zhihengliuella halotolerans TaxID=370736 RepID=UPI0011AF5AFA|nr:efflux RND transporter permease subunit [Zhihengliuella halotolerans]
MEMTSGPGGPPSCDRSEDDIWDRLDLPPDAHERACPHCTQQRERLRPLLEATRRWRTDPEETAEEDAALERIRRSAMEGIRAEIRRGRRVRVKVSQRGPIDISVFVLNEVIRRAADSVEGIELGRHGASSATDASGHPAVVCQVNVQMRPGERAVDLSNRLRAAVTDALAAELGVTPASVDITVEDIIDE